MTNSNTIRIDNVTYYISTCEHCGKLHHTQDKRRKVHRECYFRQRDSKPSKQGYVLMEYLEGFTVPLREKEIVEDLGMSRGLLWKCGEKLSTLGFVNRKGGCYLLTEKGQEALDQWRNRKI